LVRIAKAQARVHLKEEVDVQVVKEVIQSVGLIFVEFGKAVDTAVADPRDMAYNEVIEYVNRLDQPITFIEAVKHVCEHNNPIKEYLGDRLQSIGENKKLRALHDRLTDKAAGNNNCKRSRSGLTVVIKNMNPLVLVEGGKQQKEEQLQEFSQQRGVVEEFDKSNGSIRSVRPLESQQSKLTEAIGKAMLDDKGRNKGYFTKDDFIYHALMTPNLRWNVDQAEHRLYELLEDGIVEEIEPDRYRPKLQPLQALLE